MNFMLYHWQKEKYSSKFLLLQCFSAWSMAWILKRAEIKKKKKKYLNLQIQLTVKHTLTLSVAFFKNLCIRNCFQTKTLPYKKSYFKRCHWIALFHSSFRSKAYKPNFLLVLFHCAQAGSRGHSSLLKPSEHTALWPYFVLLQTFAVCR